MKYGIYYAYWEKQWGGDYAPYISRAAKLGFDILEISCASLADISQSEIELLNSECRRCGMTLTAGYGPREDQNIASPEASVVNNTLAFWADVFRNMYKLNIKTVGGGLYSYWPVDYAKPVDKPADWQRSVSGMRKMADMAENYGISLGMEVLNRHEGYLINTAAEGKAYVREVDRPNVRVMLDTYHMNMEEESFEDAIRTAGALLGHVHVGEVNRKVPGKTVNSADGSHSRIPWHSIGETLREVGYDGAVVMEPFVLRGGQVGADIKIWRDLIDCEAETVNLTLDEDAKTSLEFLRRTFGA